MSFGSSLYLGLLIIVIAVIEIILLMVNHKGRFQYKLYEQNPWWRWFDKQGGILAYLYFPASFILTVVIVPLMLSIFGVMTAEISAKILNLLIPMELILSSLFGIVIGVLSFNVYADRFSVKCFRTCHLSCGNNLECGKLLSKKCALPHVQHNKQALLSLLQENATT